ncbi:MAG: Cytochrome c biogenesis protein CcsB [Syntrophorhabdaceae bacterium PtaU1.Bin034]|jgi:cytochrome c biogenesis protein|nr:MAG: Cytochrome c biogenesis protein CcsB [Syntrophorhabdaceae bacterium PtaU1.Bin034]
MSAIRSNAGEGETPPGISSISDTFRFLSSLRFTIFLLSFIAVSCVLGTLIKQQAQPREYLAQYSESTYTILKFLGLTDVFHAPWFLFLVGLFVLNLVFCTINRLRTLIKSGRETTLPSERTMRAMSHRFFVRDRKIDQVLDLFKGYRPTVRNEGQVLLEKGSLSRYGVLLIHGSIVIILIGSLIGLLFGYRGFMTLAKGESKDSITRRGVREAALPLGFAIKCNDFRVSFYPTGEPKDYVSRVEIIDGGKSVRQADVRVNHPLTYKGVTIYQASYGSDPVFVFTIGGEQVRLSQGSVYRKDKLTFMVARFEKSVHNFGPGVQIGYLEGNEPKTAWFLKDVPKLREKEITGIPIKLNDIAEEFYTGLEVARDPGVWVVWTGFALILFGLYINFFLYHRRIYLRETAGGVLVAGASLRNKETFRDEFVKWKEKADGVE